MNFTRVLLAASLTAACSSAAFAASETELSINGAIVPSACVPVLPDAGVIDFGTYNASEISRTEHTVLGSKELIISFNCAAPTLVAIKVTDNIPGTTVPMALPNYENYHYNYTETSFGVGRSRDGSKIGAYNVELKAGSFTDSATPVTLLNSEDEDWGNHAATHRFVWSGARMISFGDATTPQPVTDVSGTMRVSLGVAFDQGLVFDDQIDIRGDALLEMVYL